MGILPPCSEREAYATANFQTLHAGSGQHQGTQVLTLFGHLAARPQSLAPQSAFRLSRNGGGDLCRVYPHPLPDAAGGFSGDHGSQQHADFGESGVADQPDHHAARFLLHIQDGGMADERPCPLAARQTDLGVDQQPVEHAMAAIFAGVRGLRRCAGRTGLLPDPAVLALVGEPPMEAAQKQAPMKKAP